MTDIASDIFCNYLLCVFVFVLLEGSCRALALVDDLLTERCEEVH